MIFYDILRVKNRHKIYHILTVKPRYKIYHIWTVKTVTKYIIF